MGALRSLGHLSHLRFGTPTVPENKKTGLYLNVLVLTRKPLIVNLSVLKDREALSRGLLKIIPALAYNRPFKYVPDFKIISCINLIRHTGLYLAFSSSSLAYFLQHL
jgi:hypothetical protein